MTNRGVNGVVLMGLHITETDSKFQIAWITCSGMPPQSIGRQTLPHYVQIDVPVRRYSIVVSLLLQKSEFLIL